MNRDFHRFRPQHCTTELSRPLVGICLAIGLTASAVAGDDAHWGYEGAEGPDHWSDLDPDYIA